MNKALKNARRNLTSLSVKIKMFQFFIHKVFDGLYLSQLDLA